MGKQTADSFAITQQNVLETTSQIKIQALKTNTVLAAQLAECCCEIKGRIDDKTSATNDLLRLTESNRVRDALNAVNTENLFLKLKAPAPVV